MTAVKKHFDEWGGLRRLEPMSRTFGLDRGRPIDRYYIENFLSQHRADIRERVLEVGDNSYTREFGREQVTQSDVLHAPPGTRNATIVGDLSEGSALPAAAFDCMILTQVFPFIFDVHAAIQNCHRALKPGGVMLVTLPGISQISWYDMERWGDFWRFTTRSARQLFEGSFGSTSINVEAHGNVLVATAFLQGLATEELTKDELDYRDDDYQLLITVRVVKDGGGA
jgi:SAM-dependent methyltransferase